jgi:hypothetical protein
LPSIILCITLSYSPICSSWNSEFSDIYPQFTLKAINKLEVTYCKELKWNLYISSSAYAKYYFALRSLTEKSDFRRYLLQFPFLECFFSFLFFLTFHFCMFRNYNVMLVNAPGAESIAERTTEMRQQVLDQNTLSRSL